MEGLSTHQPLNPVPPPVSRPDSPLERHGEGPAARGSRVRMPMMRRGLAIASSFIVITDEEKLTLLRIEIDEDPEEALDFVLRVILPKVRQTSKCLSPADLYRPS